METAKGLARTASSGPMSPLVQAPAPAGKSATRWHARLAGTTMARLAGAECGTKTMAGRSGMEAAAGTMMLVKNNTKKIIGALGEVRGHRRYTIIAGTPRESQRPSDALSHTAPSVRSAVMLLRHQRHQRQQCRLIQMRGTSSRGHGASTTAQCVRIAHCARPSCKAAHFKGQVTSKRRQAPENWITPLQVGQMAVDAVTEAQDIQKSQKTRGGSRGGWSRRRISEGGRSVGLVAVLGRGAPPHQFGGGLLGAVLGGCAPTRYHGGAALGLRRGGVDHGVQAGKGLR